MLSGRRQGSADAALHASEAAEALQTSVVRECIDRHASRNAPRNAPCIDATSRNQPNERQVSQLTRDGCWHKGLEVFEALDAMGLCPDTTITNAAISACDKGGAWEKALDLFTRQVRQRRQRLAQWRWMRVRVGRLMQTNVSQWSECYMLFVAIARKPWGEPHALP